VPEGESGHLSERRLYEISHSDFERALALLDQYSPEYEEPGYYGLVRSIERLSPGGPRGL
jgi:hypothetical protein